MGTVATRRAASTTAGVYHLAKRVMNLSTGAFLATDSSTSLSSLETVESWWGSETSSTILEDRLTVPLSTTDPGDTSLGRGSPVRALVSSVEHPSVTVPSRGTLSPGRTTILAPTGTSEGWTLSTCPSTSRLARSDCRSMRADIDSLVLRTARCSNHSPTWKNSMTATASGNSPMANAPAEAMNIRKFSSSTCPRRTPLNASRTTSYPTTM